METVTTHQDPHDGTEHDFRDSKFVRCFHSGSGGAIEQTNGGTLTITRCFFDTCSCTVRGGAVSFSGVGTCIQEENLYSHCSSTFCCGAFSSFEAQKEVVHKHKRCVYVHSQAPYYGHFCFEYSTDALIDSNIFIHTTSVGDAEWAIGTVVNYHEQGPIVYSNCIVSQGTALSSGGLSILGVYSSDAASLTVKFCFFINNFGTDNSAREIYFDTYLSDRATQDSIIHSVSATPGSSVFVQNKSPKDQEWLPLGTLSYLITPMQGTL